jgi:tetratricopeptide (TPR) repeat protein
LGNNELFDVYQAFGLPRQDNVELNVVMGGFHNIVGYWHERRVLNDFIATMINDPDWSAIYAPQFVHCESQRPNTEELLAEDMRADIEAAVVAFYHERFTEAIPVLEKVVERIPDWAGARSLLGQSYFAQDRLEAALEQFSLVSDHNSSVDGHFRDWVHTLLRMNRDDEARKIARRAYDTNKALAFLLRECEVDTDA